MNYVDNSTPLGENIKRGAFFPPPFIITAEFSYYFEWGGDNSILCGLYIEKGFDPKIASVYGSAKGFRYIVEFSQVGMERDWKCLYGTGKWNGVIAGGKAFPFTKGKPISPGTSQGCTKITGTYDLKK